MMDHRIDMLKEELDDLRATFDLWSTRCEELRGWWQAEHPDQPHTWPDLGAMMRWALEQRC